MPTKGTYAQIKYSIDNNHYLNTRRAVLENKLDLISFSKGQIGGMM